MPTYQYACTECEHAFEQVQSFTEDSLSVCPQCEGRLRKVFNAVGVVFKGSGFYRTDSRNDSRNGSKSSSSSSDSGSSSASSDAGSSSSSDAGSSSGNGSGSSTGSASSGSSSTTKGAATKAGSAA
ncbi:MAG TPA: FmdB family zinc ribbon protein [Nocardioidaceae bacterium]|nr:FmdB family zinc ribbon protein [Nocardioidaceae bacterium]